jgi:hypothetical protein
MSNLPPNVDFREVRGSLIITDRNRGYQFEKLSPTDLHGTDYDRPAAVYVGTKGSKHYITSSPLSNVPKEYLQYILDRENLTLLDNVDGGWESWEGRPEFSETYIDLDDATVIESVEEVYDDE